MVMVLSLIQTLLTCINLLSDKRLHRAAVHVKLFPATAFGHIRRLSTKLSLNTNSLSILINKISFPAYVYSEH